MSLPAPARRVLLLKNPKSGQGNADVDAFTAMLQTRGYEVTERLLDDPERNAEHVRDAREYQALVVAGGDGTVSSIAYEAREMNVPLLAFPAGTANLIAQNLNLPTTPDALADVLDGGNILRTDLAELRSGDLTWGFTLMAGAGIDAAMIKDSEELKPRFGAMAYLLSALKQFTPQQVNFRLELDGKLIETRGISVMFANFGMANFRLPVASGIDPSDGRLAVIVLKGLTPLSLLPTLIDSVRSRLNLGDPMFEDRLELYECREATLMADQQLPLQYDGELQDAALPASVRVLPGAARFLTQGTHEDLTT
ncbi:diacylglycerol/lipid kinase family protein [Deinococcus sonorensis]|uniref:Diacylglycerol kinase family protein n=2 Tax=Deinococcus sonorensis TaxID=309891 RepID=A0AAU7UCK5_9DEIO